MEEEQAGQAAQWEAWAIIELYGHQKIAGRVSEAVRFGATWMQVDVPAVDGRPGFTRFYGPGAIYDWTPTSRAVVEQAVRMMQPQQVSVYLGARELPPGGMEEGDEDDDD